MAARRVAWSPFAGSLLAGAWLLSCAGSPSSATRPASTPHAEPSRSPGTPAPAAAAAIPPEPDVVRVGPGEAVVVAPGQIVEGGWFRVAVFGDQDCGPALDGGTLQAIDFFYDNLTPETTRLFSKSASIELVNALGQSFPVPGGPRTVPGCAPWLSLGEGVAPGARLRGWPFAGVPAGADRPTQVRLVLEEPHGFAVSTVTVDLGLPPKPPGPLPARSGVGDAMATGATASAASYFAVFTEGLRSCELSDPWVDASVAAARAEGKTLRVVGLELRVENRASAGISVVVHELVDADGRAYPAYVHGSSSCAVGSLPDEIAPRASGRGTAALVLVPAGTRGLSVRVGVRPVGKSRYDGYQPFMIQVPVGDVPK